MDTGVIKAEHSPPPIPEAYVYAHRNPRLPDSPVKIGSHTGNLKRLWSRYLTYAGTMQEFKVIAVKEKEVRCFERAIQLLLERDGLWIENELFLPGAWEAFDSVVRPFALSRQCILHVFKRAATTTTISHTVPDDEFDVEDLPIMSVELTRRHNTSPPPPPAKKRRTDDDGMLPYADLSETLWQYLQKKGYQRDPDNGDLYTFTGETPFSFELQYTVDGLIKAIYDKPNDFDISGTPRESYAHNLKSEIRRLASSRCPFLVRYPNSIGFPDRLLIFENDVSKVLHDIDCKTVISDDIIELPYEQLVDATFTDIKSWLTDKISEDGRERLLAHFGKVAPRNVETPR